MPVKARTILLVEDSHVNQKVTHFLLTKLGFEVELTDSGRDAIVLAAKKEYALILMDLRLPVVDGLKATMSIREAEALSKAKRRVPIVALTASALPGDRQACLEAGMDDYISLPFSEQGLRDILTRWIGG